MTDPRTWRGEGWEIREGDAAEILRTLPDCSVDAVCTDPPAGIGFMNAKWDRDKGGRERWIEWLAGIMAECLRVAKPGSHAVVWALPRTAHWTGTALELAGWEIRDQIAHVFHQGFPKNLDIRYAIAQDVGLCRSSDTVPHVVPSSQPFPLESPEGKTLIALAPAVITPEGNRAIVIRVGEGENLRERTDTFWCVWREGTSWNIGLSWPKCWDVLCSTKRSSITSTEIGETTVQRISNSCHAEYTPQSTRQDHAQSAGCGCGVFVAERDSNGERKRCFVTPTPIAPERVSEALAAMRKHDGLGTSIKPAHEIWYLCRKPLVGTVAANVLAHGTGAINIDACRFGYGDPAWVGPQEYIGVGADGTFHKHAASKRNVTGFGALPPPTENSRPNDLGRWPANVYYCAKPSTAEREAGCENLEHQSAGELTGGRAEGSDGLKSPRAGAGRTSGGRGNAHPTVKPVALLRWLCRLITPPGGLVLDPFVGSGTTLIAAHEEGFRSIGVELDPHHCEIAVARIRDATRQGRLAI